MSRIISIVIQSVSLKTGDQNKRKNQIATRVFHSYKNLLKRHSLTYADETMTIITQRYINERRILRTILGAVKTQSNRCINRMNHEIEEEIDGDGTLAEIIKAQRIK